MRQLARVRGQQQVPVRGQLRQVRVRVQQQPVRGPVQVQVRGPRHRRSLWLRWPGSKQNFSSIHQVCFSKHHRQSCASC